MAMQENPGWISERKAIELENAERIRYFDLYIDDHLAGKLPFEDAVQAYKETLEHQGIPLTPQKLGSVALKEL